MGQNCWKHNSTLFKECHGVRIIGVFALYRHLHARKLIRKHRTCITISRHESDREGSRKVPHLSASKDGIRKQTEEKLKRHRVLQTLPFFPGTFVLYPVCPKACAEDTFCSVTPEEQSDQGIRGTRAEDC